MNNFKRIPAVFFTYDLWKAGSLTLLGIPHRKWYIINNKNHIRKKAVGFIEGEKLHVRLKKNYIAVMFFCNEEHFWTHLRKDEFEAVFNTKVEIFSADEVITGSGEDIGDKSKFAIPFRPAIYVE